MAKASFPESVLLKLPEGTLDKVRDLAEREGSSPTDFMRRAVVRAVRSAEECSVAA